MSRLEQLIRYISNVFHALQLVKRVSDSRDKSRIQIPTSAILLAWILGFCARTRSREDLGRLLDRPALRKLVGSQISSDTLGRVLGQIDSDSLRKELLVPVVREIRRNKAWKGGTVHGQLLIGIDGSEAFCTQKQPCPACSFRDLKVKVKNKTDGEPDYIREYYHQAVWAFIVGTQPRVYLDVEPIGPHEGEVTAAIRLVSRLAEQYGRWIDGIVADHLFAGSPFLNHVRNVGFHYIVRVKDQERRHLLQEANERSAHRDADIFMTRRYGHKRLAVTLWDEEGFTAWRALAAPTRVLVCDEVELPQLPNRRRKKLESERKRPRAFFATSYTKSAFCYLGVWLAYHHRWDIENTGFHQFKHEWHWDHAFVHTPEALPNLWLLMAVAANLFLAFVSRRLNTTRAGATPFRTVAQELAALLLTLTPDKVPSWNSS